MTKSTPNSTPEISTEQIKKLSVHLGQARQLLEIANNVHETEYAFTSYQRAAEIVGQDSPTLIATYKDHILPQVDKLLKEPTAQKLKLSSQILKAGIPLEDKSEWISENLPRYMNQYANVDTTSISKLNR